MVLDFVHNEWWIIDRVQVLASGVGYALSPSVTVLAGNAGTFASNIRKLTGNKFKTSKTVNGDYLGAVEGGLQ